MVCIFICEIRSEKPQIGEKKQPRPYKDYKSRGKAKLKATCIFGTDKRN